MHLSHPERSIAPTLDMPVLACLSRQDRLWSTREVADATQASLPGVRDTLARLTQSGLVMTTRVGRARAYQLNRDHVLANPIREIINANSTLRERITDCITSWAVPADLAAVFGSWAAGTSDSESDIDLFFLYSDEVVADDLDRWEAQIGELQRRIRTWSGNDCDALAFTRSEWGEHLQRRDPLSVQILGTDVIVLHGKRSLLSAPITTRDVA